MTQATTTTAEIKKWDGGHSPFNLSYGKIMMWFFLLSDALTFGALLISYGTKRFFSNVWPDSNHVFKSFPGLGDKNLPLMFVSLMTFILILSSVTMVLAVHAGHYKDKKAVIKWLLFTIIGGIAFLSCQCWEWVHLHGEGAWWGSFVDPATTPKASLEHFYNPKVFAGMSIQDGVNATTSFFNFFFTITGFHGMHVLSGVLLNVMILVNTVNGTYERRGHYEMIEKVGLYWHFVDLVWVFVFTCFYLL
ncbi:cytochrome c oxidase subunit 3 [Taibaiella helva]|uniref:cytochrome c oxidase subunit 3 n=1 Tax=Taibaiella helva TaxID=2301235 RepID=UPI000E56FBC7|nr:cytochrome c oxidase subunit 3 [Taibaiella helva]